MRYSYRVRYFGPKFDKRETATSASKAITVAGEYLELAGVADENAVSLFKGIRNIGAGEAAWTNEDHAIVIEKTAIGA